MSPRDRAVGLYGLPHSVEWLTALDPDAPLWGSIPLVECIGFLDTSVDLADWDHQRRTETVLIPLLEKHLLNAPKGFRYLKPTPDQVALMGNKRALDTFLVETGFQEHVPATYPDHADAHFPCIVKRLDLWSGNGVAVAATPGQLSMLLEIDPFKGQDHLLQELIPGNLEYVTHLVCKNGKILYACSYEWELTGPAQIRDPVNPIGIRPWHCPAEISELFAEIIDALGYSGPCNVNFKLHEGRPVIFEINPRLGGSLMKPENIADLSNVIETIIRHAECLDAPEDDRSEPRCSTIEPKPDCRSASIAPHVGDGAMGVVYVLGFEQFDEITDETPAVPARATDPTGALSAVPASCAHLRISTLMLANYVTPDSGLVHVLNGGWSGCGVVNVPILETFHILCVIEAGGVDSGDYEVDLEAHNPAGRLVSRVKITLRVESRGAVARTSAVYSWALNVDQLGIWRFAASLSGTQLAAIDLMIS